MVIRWFADLWTWWSALSPEMVFFFSIPFIVATCGLLEHLWRQRRGRG